METIILIVSQILFSLSRTLNVRYVSKGKMISTLVAGFIVKITWLISSAIGINSVINQNWKNVLIYLLSGLIGDYLAMKIKIK
tara:strand:+ start:257 stop:505 length:249 start_codon:yes stop_codon:yes gene_type:complete